jgi:SAM-dependent methyltransferase
MERTYVLGTNDEEIERLGLQHRVWRPRVSLAWQKAGFTLGQTLLDVGCGPGYATRDLAEIVGPTGQVWALERSRRFLDALAAFADRERLANIRTVELDLDEDPFPDVRVDGAWVRWVLCFVRRPREVLRKLARCVKPGGTVVIHEYFDYRSWRMAPGSPELDEFVEAVIASWRAAGGEPDIGLELPTWLAEEGFEIDETLPIIEAATADGYVREWPRAFLRTGVDNLVKLGHVTAERAPRLSAEIERRLDDPRTIVFTPAVLEVRATRA